ncbi:MAG TPA: ABC transporter ATP-binding protein [bacterium]|jgi:ABC-2 type transport system ATP-binding protein|nr:ABC transporter ATP-binding protein [bacterium]
MTPYSVEVKNLTVQFGPFTAVNDISFAVQPGEIFGFLGANGAGKTTTIRVLCGLLIPTAGEVRVTGLNPKDGLEAIKARVGYMSQKFTLYQDMSVEENLDFTSALHKIPRDVQLKRQKEWLEFIRFKENPKRLVRELSGGTKQEVSLVAALLHDPEIVFLDEPTAGVSPVFRARFWSIIQGLSKRGKTVFVTTHYMDEAEQCGRIALMRDGRIIANGSPAELKKLAFAEPIYEITPKTHSRTWLETLKKESSVEEVNPYGMRFHIVVKDAASWQATANRMAGDFDQKPIQPSLEDVFIRLVEGKAK